MTAPAKLPITNRNTKLSLIHIAKKNSGIADDAYRILLEGAAGVDSAAKIEYEYQFRAVMEAFKNLGFISTANAEKKTRPQWTDEWGGTEDQRAKIEVLWKSCARNKSETALRAFIKRITHVDHPRFLNVQLAQKVILALEAMARKDAKKKEDCNVPVKPL
jgi:hypothetical protein